MYLLGYDIGSSSVKASLVDAQSGERVASAFYPKVEMEIKSVQSGWAEQEPESWWKNLQLATADVLKSSGIKSADVAAIGISYQMHGLVLVDKDQQVLRPSIIWCDSRAVPYGSKALNDLGKEWCLAHLLNSPGNFTASKLAWVKENEPEIFAKIDKIMLPGDYIAMKLTGVCSTTVSGLSEGMFWDFKEGKVSDTLMTYYGFSESLIPAINPTFSIQGEVSESAAALLGLKAGTPVSYRAGDQPNNALSLNVLNPGEIASTAGTSGVVYGVNGKVNFDPQSRVNSFAHVNHTAGIPNRKAGDPELERIGVLLCINGTGILNSWMKHKVVSEISYEEMNDLASKSPIGANGLSILPFGNGAERLLENANPGCSIHGIQFNVHGQAEMLRAAQEGIVFSFAYGMEVMNGMGIETKLIRAGLANMFLSPIFRDTLAGVTGATIELYDTDGSVGAAKGAGIGAGIYKDAVEAFSSLRKLSVIEPDVKNKDAYQAAYQRWKSLLK
ncbi:MAG: FGGY family carbohydrate kinase [Bacteroidales bacterium]|nr:FGGY family carbohydrate kinase [Bacteroidales bacterium]